MAKIRGSALPAVVAASITATDCITLTDMDPGTKKSYRMTMEQARTALFAGGAGYNAADTLSVPGAVTFGAHLTVTGPITAAAGFDTTLTSLITGDAVLFAGSATTARLYGAFSNTDGQLIWGIESSVGTGIFTGGTPYAAVIGTQVGKPFQIATNDVVRMTVAASGAIAMTGALGVTGISSIGGSTTGTTFDLAWSGSTGGSIQTFLSKPLTLNASGNPVNISTAGELTTVAGRLAITQATVGSSTITGTRLIGGADITGAVAPGVFSDGTPPANNAYGAANVFELLVSKANSATTGATVTSEVYHKQTGANAAGSAIASFSYIDSANTSGTTLLNVSNVASVEATGNGGTTTTLGCYRTQAVIGTGATITNLSLIDIRSPANSGTITTLVGLDIQAMTAGGTNYAIRTAGGRILFGSLPTSSAGLPTGTLWNNSGVLNVA